MNRTKTKIALAAGLSLIASTAFAQQGEPRVALYDDWSVFAPNEPKECFVASAPTKTSALRGGVEVTVRRGDIRFYVTNRPAENTFNEVSYTGGYPFRDGSTVSVTIGSDTYEMFTEGEHAWPVEPADDKKLVAALRRGSTAIVRAVSSRGTNTIDTFSLIGFSDALKDADGRCAN